MDVYVAMRVNKGSGRKRLVIKDGEKDWWVEWERC